MAEINPSTPPKRSLSKSGCFPTSSQVHMEASIFDEIRFFVSQDAYRTVFLVQALLAILTDILVHTLEMALVV